METSNGDRLLTNDASFNVPSFCNMLFDYTTAERIQRLGSSPSCTFVPSGSSLSLEVLVQMNQYADFSSGMSIPLAQVFYSTTPALQNDQILE